MRTAWVCDNLSDYECFSKVVAVMHRLTKALVAYGSLFCLAGLPFIDPDQIAVVGYSDGADTALQAVKLGGIETQFGRHFRTAVA